LDQVEPTFEDPAQDAPGGSSEAQPWRASDLCAPEIPAVKPRFCTGCGAAWQDDWLDCPWCRDSQSPAKQGKVDAVPVGRSVRSALWLYFVLLGANVIGMILISVEGASETGVDIALSLAFCGIVFIWSLANPQWVRPYLATLGRPRHYLLAVLIGLGTFAVAMASIEGAVRLLEIESLSFSRPFLKDGYGWLVVFLIVAVQPAVIEELAFRGVMLDAFKRGLGRNEAVVVSALLFMILHVLPLSFPFLLLMGLATAWLRLASGSLYPCMLLHFVHNSLVLLAERMGY